MMLIAFIAIPILAGLLAWPLGNWRPAAGRWVCLLALLANLGLAVACWATAGSPVPAGASHWLSQVSYPWIPQFGVRFTLAMDGMSLLLIALTNFLGVVGVLCSWEAVQKRVGFFHLNLMWLLGALVGVFLAMDLFLFYFFWEMMLVPLYLIIGIWGYERRIYATIKFFLFTQAGSLLMLVAIIALAYMHRHASGVWTFDYGDLLSTPLSQAAATWLMLGFLAAFAVKLPALGLHTWLPDAHTEAPTAGSVVLAGLVLKAGAYGMLRFMVPMFPLAVREFAPLGMTVAVIGIIYGGVTAFGQRDLKRLVAYTSVSHMGFVLLAVFTWNTLAMQGAMVVILAHGLSTGALFVFVGALQDRIHTRDLRRMGGLWTAAPRMGGVTLFFALASLGLPGLANFVGEFLVLLGTFQVNRAMAIIAATGLVVSVIYSLWMFQRTFHGPPCEPWKMKDLGAREIVMAAALIAGVVWIGVYPKGVLDLSAPAMKAMSDLAGWSLERQTASNSKLVAGPATDDAIQSAIHNPQSAMNGGQP